MNVNPSHSPSNGFPCSRAARCATSARVHLAELGETQTLLDMESIRVTPAQFLGIEIKRWAKEIADLVLWIGYIQWHFRTQGTRLPVPEPVLCN